MELDQNGTKTEVWVAYGEAHLGIDQDCTTDLAVGWNGSLKGWFFARAHVPTVEPASGVVVVEVHGILPP